MKLHFSKIKLTALALLFTILAIAQQSGSAPLTPGGIMDTVYDRFANKYALKSLELAQHLTDGDRVGSAITTTCSAGYFNLYFETNGLGSTNQAANQAVICQVFSDISAFISSPLTTTGNHVNVWVRDFTSVAPAASGILGLASQFYAAPVSTTVTGIVDGEVQKTIISGVDSYTGVSPFLNPTGAGIVGASGVYFHSMIAFDLNSYPWNTSLTTGATGSYYDLYTVVLHEATHTLGFASLIDANGLSKLAPWGLNYFSRFDSFLTDNSGSPLLTQSGTSCPNYQYAFNSSISTSELAPSVASCTTDINFAGTVNQKCYTPSLYASGSSLSHMDDPCHSPTSYTTGGYYVMSYATSPGISKRYYKDEERAILCNLGYSVGTVFGTPTYSLSYNNYGGSACPGIGVAGVNDGLNSVGNYIYSTTTGTLTIPVSAILGNDYNATSLSCVQTVYPSGTVSVVGSNIVYTANPNFFGAVLIRYLPMNGSTAGNITYITGFFLPTNCTPASGCNMIQNGGFETLSATSTYQCGDGYYPGFSQANPNVNMNCWYQYINTPDLYTRGCNNSGDAHSNMYDLATNTFGSIPTWDSHNPSTGNDHVLGLAEGNYQGGYTLGGYCEAMQNFLGAPLVPGQAYQLSFWAYNYQGEIYYPDSPTQVDPYNVNPAGTPQIMTFGATQQILLAGTFNSGYYPPTTGMDVIMSYTLATPINTWAPVSMTFTYSGAANDNVFFIGTDYAKNLAAGYTAMPQTGGNDFHYMLIDDVVLLPFGSAPTFSLPVTSYTCNASTVTNLAQYATPPGGVFTGPGVSVSGGIYNFDPNSAGNGVQQIVYTYTDNIGCVQSITEQVNIAISTMTLSATGGSGICPGQTTTLSATGATSYTWSPGAATTSTISVSPSSTQIYTVTGTTGSCTGTNTISVIVSPTPSITASASSYSVCGAQTLTLSASGAASYTWTPFFAVTTPFLSTVAVTPSTSVVYTVTGTNPGCPTAGTATISIAVKNPFLALSPSTTICSVPGTATLIASSYGGTTTYTWSPAGTLNTTSGALVVATPTTAVTIYTVTGNTAGCIVTNTISVTTNSVIPSINVYATSTNICVGQGVVMNATGGYAGSYTWTPGIASSWYQQSVAPLTTTTYTASNIVNGCVGSNTITITVNPQPTITVVASPTPACTNVSTTVTASGATTYSWSVGGITTNSVVISWPNPGTKNVTIYGINSSGCNSSTNYSIAVTATPTLALSAVTNPICVGSSTAINATGSATNYSWSPGGSLNVTTGSHVTATPGTTTTYTVVGTAATCSASTAITITVTPTPTLVITPSTPTVCAAASETLTATGGTSYTWSPGTGLSTTTGSVTIASPTVTTTYTLTGSNGGCVVTKTVSVFVPANSCSGTPPSSYTLTTSGTYSTATGGYISQNLYIGTASTAINYTISAEVRMAPTVSISIAPGNTLTVSGAWLHSCATCTNSMWQGITVQSGAKLITTNNSIIEDAVQAVYSAPTGTTTLIPNINLTNTIFNKNGTDIYFDKNAYNLSADVVYNDVFTCRTLTSHSTTATNFTAIKNDVVAAASYTYTATNPTTNTLNGSRSKYGVYMNYLTYTTTPIQIGSTTTPTLNINVFDNLDYGVYDMGAAVTIKNNRFQNHTGNSNATLPIGIGVYLSDGKLPGGAVVIGNPTATLVSGETNYFANCLRGIMSDMWSLLYINNNKFTNEVTASTFTTSGTYVAGEYATFNNRFNINQQPERMMFNSNNVQNYANGLFTDFNQLQNTGSQIYMIISNTITATGTNYCNNGMQFQQSGSTGSVVGQLNNAFTVYSNTISNINTNCISLNSVNTPTTGTSSSWAQVSNNTELSLKYATTYTAPGVAAISISNCNSILVNSNINIKSLYTGTYSAANNQYLAGIYVSQSPSTTVTCNQAKSLGEDYVWYGNSLGSKWLENHSNNSRYGLVLRSAGVMGDQGSSGHPIYDIWGSNTDITSAQTLCDATNPSLTPSSKLFILTSSCTTTSVTLPCTNTVSLGGGAAYSSATLSVTTGSSPNLCSGEGGGGGSMAMGANSLSSSNTNSMNNSAALQSLINPSTTLPVYDMENRWATQYYVSSQDQSISAATGYENAKTFALIDQQVAAGNYATAQNNNNSVSPINIVETNWQNVNAVVFKQALSITPYLLTTSDVNSLNAVAIQCPITGGAKVWKARAMLNTYYGRVLDYSGDCHSNTGVHNRLANTTGITATTEETQTVTVYPNPNNGKMMFEYSIKDDASLEIMDLNGRLVGTYNLPAESNQLEIINNQLYNGVYMYRVTSNGNVIKIGRIVVMQ